MSQVRNIIKNFIAERKTNKKRFTFNGLYYHLNKEGYKNNFIEIANGYKKTFNFDDGSFISFTSKFNTSCLKVSIVGGGKRTDLNFINNQCKEKNEYNCDIYGRKI